ncbi:N-acetylmuramoyl-L-alanine amidase [Hathewaya proteolytica DSM 3090]|uniref:N-acetylmuramoyl-L-alanine amidase n=1 Tax=Hathewaya proteolytica DSM 3090 TaxID=1121331 RepID=A0A1M6RLC6_9CLOT|nr:N-acetylmuramoyl-L-alanine amidase [Hathewaya proteolytica]SHK33252.1 N-acetylmuramoyl-L-alanine amidase [Hathewaya proteolytica DSM 3090]
MAKGKVSKIKSKRVFPAICSLIILVSFIITSNIVLAEEIISPTVANTPIMGEQVMSRGQAFTFLRERNKAKTDIYIEEFVQITWEEAKIEGIRPDVAFCQMMLETGFLKFGGDVKEEQNNFAGIGATGSGAPGHSFPSIRIGVRAVIQHLKAYASKEPLNQECVDPRYHLVKKGCAPYVEDLSGKWAVGSDYGGKIISLINTGKELIDHQAVSSLKDFYVKDAKTQKTIGFEQLFNNREYYITAKAESTNKPLYKFWTKNNKTGEIKILTDYTENDKFLWSAPANTDYYSIGVCVKDKYAVPEIEVQDQWERNVKVVAGKAKVSNVAIYSGNKRVDNNEIFNGMQYTLRATAKADTEALYQFRIKDLNTNKWTVLRDFSESSTYQWKVTSDSDNYVLGVRVKDKHGNEGVYGEKYSGVIIKTLSGSIDNFNVYNGSNVVNEVNVGDTYTIKATATGINNPVYRFWIKDVNNKNISVLKDYSTASEFKWVVNGVGERYILGVDVRGDNMDSSQKFTKQVEVKAINTGAKLESFNSYLGDMEISTGIHVPGAKYTLKAKATSKNRPMYQFWVKDVLANKWTMIKDYGYENTCQWTAPKVGEDYQIGVHVKDERSIRDFDDHKYVSVKIYQPEVEPCKVDIVLDAGHGNTNLKTNGIDSGAVGVGGVLESNLTQIYVKKLGAYLESLGYKVLYTRDFLKGYNQVTDDLQQRVDVANYNNASLFFSMHFNSYADPSVSGIESYYSSFRPNLDNTDIVSTENLTYDKTPTQAAIDSKQLGADILNSLSTLGFNNRGVKDRGLYVTKNTNMPSILLEGGFLTNSDEIKKLTDPSFQDKMVKIIGDSVRAFLDK